MGQLSIEVRQPGNWKINRGDRNVTPTTSTPLRLMIPALTMIPTNFWIAIWTPMIRIGASVADVQALFDDSGRESTSDATHTVRIYGKDAQLGWFPVPTVTVVYKAGRVESVWTEYSCEYTVSMRHGLD